MEKFMIRAGYECEKIDPEQFDENLFQIMSYEHFKEKYDSIYESAKEYYEEEINKGHEGFEIKKDIEKDEDEDEDDYEDEDKYFEDLSEKEQAEYIEEYEWSDEIFYFKTINEQEVEMALEFHKRSLETKLDELLNKFKEEVCMTVFKNQQYKFEVFPNAENPKYNFEINAILDSDTLEVVDYQFVGRQYVGYQYDNVGMCGYRRIYSELLINMYSEKNNYRFDELYCKCIKLYFQNINKKMYDENERINDYDENEVAKIFKEIFLAGYKPVNKFDDNLKLYKESLKQENK